MGAGTAGLNIGRLAALAGGLPATVAGQTIDRQCASGLMAIATAAKQVMVNLRVTELDRLIQDLSDAGIAVTTNPEWDSPETGRFARIHDPEGNPIELWQPPED